MRDDQITFLKRKYIVNRKLQLTIILYSLVLAGIVSLIDFAFQYIIFHPPRVVSRVNLPMLFLGIGFIVFVTAIFAGVILTNRVAGPMFRLRAHMDDVADGKILFPLDFRKNDFFLELIIPYNKILTKLKEKP
jgi:nitrogen fixation/metabolism regulation signal transduction histidine kinase